MAQSWYSIVEKEVSSVDDVMGKEVRSAYPELNDMCEATLQSRFHIVRPALGVLTYYANGGRDADVAVNTASCFEAVFEGRHLHDRIDSTGAVTGLKKKMFSKVPSTTKVIVAGDFMYVMGFRLAYGKVPDVVPYLMKVSASISDSIFMIVDREHDSSVTEEECLEILKRKSAVEYEVIMECAAKEAGADDAIKYMAECGQYIGMALQLESDLEDLFEPKPVMETLTTGYPTLPIYYSMQDEKVGARIKEVFSTENPSPKDASRAIALMRETDAVERCQALIAECMSKANVIIARLPDSVYRSELLRFTENDFQ